MKGWRITALLCSIVCFAEHETSAQQLAGTEAAAYLHRAMKNVTDVMVHDIYSPPVSSRTYAYVSVAAYETLRPSGNGYVSFAGQLHGLTELPNPPAGGYEPVIAAVEAMLMVGKAMVISEERVNAFRDSLQTEWKSLGISDEQLAVSKNYGQAVAVHILKWASSDKYRETRTMALYTVKGDSASWKPTPPAYIKAIEPNWRKMRTFLIDSAEQFKPIPPPRFSLDSGSVFYQDAMAVYNAVKDHNPEQEAIANFWDCNPYKMNVRGHLMYATKKISPNGHWMNITRIVCEKKGADAITAAETYASVAITMADCFISCWDEKYRSIVIRPETYINQYIDPGWLPILQTPPFPEYTSGHSVVSSGAAVILSKLFGDDFGFTDSSEMEFGLPPRRFESFWDAANEAAISRFYGGIHYMPAIRNGQTEGRELGEWVAARLRTREERVSAK